MTYASAWRHLTAFAAFAAFAAFGALLVIVTPAASAVTGCKAQSGRQTVPLVELYTSEGCDSCPPADRWLSSTFAPGDTRDGAVVATPLSFHVDYWDRLGWKDRFATPAWTKRQYDSARAAHSDLVYTPQVLLQGRDLRDWHAEKRSVAAIAAAGRAPARAEIALEIVPRTGAVEVRASARVPETALRKSAVLFVALTDDGLASEVKAGENKGKRLLHDHVVRELRGDIAIGPAGEGSGTFTLPLPAEAGKSSSIVAFVQSADSGDVLQTLALPLSAACPTVR